MIRYLRLNAPSLQGGAEKQDAAIGEGQQWQPRLTHQWQAGRHLLQL